MTVEYKRTRRMIDANPPRDTGDRIFKIALLIIVFLLIIPVGLVAVLSGASFIRLPYEMFLLAERIPLLFRTHMLSASAALLLLPLTIAFRNRPHIHRALGRTLGGFVVLAGLTALPVAVLSHSPPLARAGFFVQGLVWLWLLVRGWQTIRAGRRTEHAKLMLGMAAVTTGAVWFRLITGLALMLPVPFDAAYAFAAWAGWLLPLIFVWNTQTFTRSILR